jgi:hypothetical protein
MNFFYHNLNDQSRQTVFRHPETMKKNNGTLKEGQAVLAPYLSHASREGCRELASPVPNLGIFIAGKMVTNAEEVTVPLLSKG